MTDEHPDADTGDAIFILQEQEHSSSLVEALCALELEITHFGQLEGEHITCRDRSANHARV